MSDAARKFEKPPQIVVLPAVDWQERRTFLESLRDRDLILMIGEDDNLDVVASYLMEYGYRMGPGPTPNSIFLPRGPRLGQSGWAEWNPLGLDGDGPVVALF